MLEENQGKEIQVRNDSKKTSMVGVLLILIAVGLYVFYSGALSNKLDITKADVLTKSSEFENLKSQLAALSSAEEELSLTTEVERIESLKAIPVQLEQDEVIRDLMEIAKNHDINLHSISFGKSGSGADGVSTLIISASFEGNYADLTEFLEGIEQNARLFKVKTISVQLSRLDISDIERANFSLTIESFYQE